MWSIFFWTIIFSIAGAATTILLADRTLLNGNLLKWQSLVYLIFYWKFILAMFCAFIARYSFMIINSDLLKIPSLAQNSTTVAALITSVSFLILLAGNAIFLGERMNLQQGIGGAFIMVGVWIIVR